MTVRLDAGGHGARFDISGTLSNNATWYQDIYFYENDVGMDISGLSFELQFRSNHDDTSAQVTLSTAASDLIITSVAGGVSNVLRINNVPYTRISALVGDYITDLVSKDDDDVLIHWGHGVMLFRQAPVAF